MYNRHKSVKRNSTFIYYAISAELLYFTFSLFFLRCSPQSQRFFIEYTLPRTDVPFFVVGKDCLEVYFQL